MASFINANLPSEDEEDDDYRPDQDKTAEAADREEFIAAQAKRPREDEEDEEDYGASLLAEDTQPDSRREAKRAKIDLLWNLLNSKPTSAASTPSKQNATSTPATPATAPAKLARVGPSNTVNIASLCRTVGAKERKSMDSDAIWKRNLGILAPKQQAATPVPSPIQPAGTHPDTSSQQQTPDKAQPALTSADQQLNGASSSQTNGNGNATITEEAKAVAAAALAAAQGAISTRNQSKVTITETRRFAGKDIQVTRDVDKNSKEAAKAGKPPPPAAKSGLDAFLAETAKKKKVNVLDKSKADWQQVKKSDASLEEELEAHRRSGNQYLDKVDFLKRTELKEYEMERDKRLAADVRTRGRL